MTPISITIEKPSHKKTTYIIGLMNDLLTQDKSCNPIDSSLLSTTIYLERHEEKKTDTIGIYDSLYHLLPELLLLIIMDIFE